jgi:hypothetical protein
MNSTSPKLFLELAEWAWLDDPILGPAVARATQRIKQANPQCTVFDHKIYVDTLCPCVHRGMLSVALCCTHAREHAQVGDWVCLWWVKTDGASDLLCAIFRVDEAQPIQDYYNEQYISRAKRPDQIYVWTPAGLQHRHVDGLNQPTTFHSRGTPQEIQRHLLADSSGRVLISSTYWHGGHSNLRKLPGILCDWIPASNQRHRQFRRPSFEPAAVMRHLIATDRCSVSSGPSEHIADWGTGTKLWIQSQKRKRCGDRLFTPRMDV